MIIVVKELTADDRNRLRTGFMVRMDRSDDPLWRNFWETEVLFLDGREGEAVTRLHDLAQSENRNVALAALMSLGEWYEHSGSIDNARKVYEQAAEKHVDTPSTLLARASIARLHNKEAQPGRAIALLEEIAATIDSAPADVVQFIAAEYCEALRRLGRFEDARAFFRRVTTLFPNHTELMLLEQHFLGNSNT